MICPIDQISPNLCLVFLFAQSHVLSNLHAKLLVQRSAQIHLFKIRYTIKSHFHASDSICKRCLHSRNHLSFNLAPEALGDVTRHFPGRLTVGTHPLVLCCKPPIVHNGKLLDVTEVAHGAPTSVGLRCDFSVVGLVTQLVVVARVWEQRLQDGGRRNPRCFACQLVPVVGLATGLIEKLGPRWHRLCFFCSCSRRGRRPTEEPVE
mmetsp:Transcript_82496/g.120873  ORF Transcript_82496/g.120873 Transcript_82496/m.120873 type:complete len:206 (+) Transcript_82496:630-1247(+)